MPNPVVHREIQSNQVEKVREFYKDLFDWHVEEVPQMSYNLVDTHAEGGINGGIGPAQGHNRVTFYVGVDDPQAHLDKVERLGGKTVVPVTEVPGIVTMALFSDPEGNIVGLVKNEQRT